MAGVKLSLSGMDDLRRALQQMPGAVRTRILLPAAKNAIRTIYKTAEGLIPVSAHRKQRKGNLGHYRNNLTYVVREYPNSESVIAIVGAESGTAPHATLVEHGTRPRFTNSKPQYQRTATGVKTVVKRGQAVTKVVYQRKSIGSKQKRKKSPQLYRGVMPAFHPIKRGIDNSASAVATGLRNDIQAGITRELTAAKLQRGSP